MLALRVGALACAVAASLMAALAARPGIARAAYPPCFGAAARDPHHRCRNPALTFSVRPIPSEALIMPNTPCTPLVTTPEICSFGVPASIAVNTTALIGDSHAWQWRGAVQVVAATLHWQALSITRYTCPFTEGVAILPEPLKVQCTEWNRQVLQWFAQHPEITTVFVSNHPGRVVRSQRQGLLAAQVAGIDGAWNALPPTVKHIIVIRDTPFMHEDTLACVERARERHRDAGNVCAVHRFGAVRYDPDLIAARRMRSPRVQVVDLTHFFCSTRLCYPVVGGALVYRDAGHISSVYALTLGKYMLRKVAALMTSWR